MSSDKMHTVTLALAHAAGLHAHCHEDENTAAGTAGRPYVRANVRGDVSPVNRDAHDTSDTSLLSRCVEEYFSHSYFIFDVGAPTSGEPVMPLTILGNNFICN